MFTYVKNNILTWLMSLLADKINVLVEKARLEGEQLGLSQASAYYADGHNDAERTIHLPVQEMCEEHYHRGFADGVVSVITCKQQLPIPVSEFRYEVEKELVLDWTGLD